MLLLSLVDRARRDMKVQGFALAAASAALLGLLYKGPARWRLWRLRLQLLCSRSTEATDPLTPRIGQLLPYLHSSFSLESMVRAMEFQPRPSDVFVLTPPKTGTTWMQALCHFIRSGGTHDDFEDLYQVAPWDQFAWDLDQRLDEEHLCNPRIFKTHLPLSTINRGAKYLCVIRDPEPTLLSWYNFLLQKEVPPVVSAGNPSTFVLERPGFVGDGMRFGPNLWGYYSEFSLCLDLPCVLVLAYEDILEDVGRHLPVIVDFLGLQPLDASTAARVLGKVSREEMMRDASKYDESWTHKEARRVGRTPEPDSWKPAARVKAASSGKQELNEQARAFIRQKWQDEVQAKTGLPDYSALRARVKDELEVRLKRCQLKR